MRDRVEFGLLCSAILLLGPLHIALILAAAEGQFLLHGATVGIAGALLAGALILEASTEWDTRGLKVFLLLVIGPALVAWVIPHTQTGLRIFNTADSADASGAERPIYLQHELGDFSVPRY